MLDGVELGVLDSVELGLGVELGVLETVEDGVELGVLEGVADGVAEGVFDGVADGVRDGVELGVALAVELGELGDPRIALSKVVRSSPHSSSANADRSSSVSRSDTVARFPSRMPTSSVAYTSLHNQDRIFASSPALIAVGEVESSKSSNSAKCVYPNAWNSRSRKLWAIVAMCIYS